MLRWACDLGFQTTLLEPDPGRVDESLRAVSDRVCREPGDVEVAAEGVQGAPVRQVRELDMSQA